MGGRMGGRPPRPAAINEANGSYINHPNRRRPPEPKPELGEPEKPKSILDDKESLAVWTYVCDQLKTMGVLATSDVYALETFCNTISECRKNVTLLRKEGHLVEGKDSVWVKNPRVQIVHQLRELVHKVGSSFGLDPVSRARLAVAEPAPDDPLAEWMKTAGIN